MFYGHQQQPPQFGAYQQPQMPQQPNNYLHQNNGLVTNSFVNQFIPITNDPYRSQMVNIDVKVSMQETNQYRGFIINSAIATIQREAGSNQLRCGLFNLMSVNSYANADFQKFCNDLIRYIELSAIVDNFNGDFASYILQKIEIFTTFRCANLVATYPILQQQLDINTLQAAEEIRVKFFTEVSNKENALNSLSRQSNQNNGFQPQFPIYPQQPVMPHQPVMGNNRLFTQNNTTVNTNYNGFSNNIPQAPLNSNPNNTLFIQNEVLPKSVKTTPLFPETETTKATYVNETKVDTKLLTNYESVDTTELGNGVVYYTTFNPNLDNEVLTQKLNTHIVKINISKGNKVDINRHLAIPTITPNFIAKEYTTLDQNKESLSEALDFLDDATMIKPLGENAAVAFSEEEHWSILDAASVYEKDKLEKEYPEIETHRLFTNLTGNILTPVLCNDNTTKAVIDVLKELDSPTDVVNTILDLKTEIYKRNYNNGDVKIIQELDKLLTNSTVEFLKKELNIPTYIDSYIEDSINLYDYLKKTYGENIADQFSKAHRRIVRRALQIGDKDYKEAIIEQYYSFLTFTIDKPVILTFNKNVSFNRIDLSTIELCLDWHHGDTALINEAQHSGLLKQVRKIMSQEDIRHYYLKTTDNVIFELTHAVLIPGNVFITKIS